MRNQGGIKLELLKKVNRRICVRNITFLTERTLFYAFFLLLSSSTPFSFRSDVIIEWMAPIKINDIAMGGIMCYDIMSERSKI